MTCEFYKIVQKEEGPKLSKSADILQRLK
jgi:hypothetical protein